MSEGLVCIALAAAHLEAQQQRKPPSAQFVNRQSAAIVPTIPTRHGISEGPRVISNNVDASSDEDPITDPEETLAQILAEQPKETPAPPTADEVITTVQPDDVLCGRGGETNHHPGNVQYRGLVKKYQRLYLKAKRRDKPKIARLIVDTVRRRSGRFLKKDPVGGVWKDVGNNKAREKTSQALREGAPEIREGDTKRKLPPGLIPIGNLVSPNSSSSSLPLAAGAAYEMMASANKKMKMAPAAPVFSAAAVEALGMAAAAGSEAGRGPRLHRLKSRLSSEKLNGEEES